MAWTIAVVIAVLGLSSILLFLNKSFDKSKFGIKTLLTMLCLGSLILLSGLVSAIVQDKSPSAGLSNLTKLTTSFTIITISIFSFFILYFFITYLTGTFRAVRDENQDKRENIFNED